MFFLHDTVGRPEDVNTIQADRLAAGFNMVRLQVNSSMLPSDLQAWRRRLLPHGSCAEPQLPRGYFYCHPDGCFPAPSPMEVEAERPLVR